MRQTFADIVEGIKPLSMDEKQELMELIKKFLIEEERREIVESVAESKAEGKAGRLQFSSDIDSLKEMLANG